MRSHQIPQALHEECGHQVVKFMTQMSRLSDFHSSASFLFAGSKDRLEERKCSELERLATHTNLTPILSAIASVTGSNPSTWLAQEMTKGTSANSVLLVDASSVVFAHSLLEAHLYLLCLLCFRAFPKEWEPFIASKELKPMTVRELLSRQTTDFLEPVWKSEFTRLDRSLLAKADRLHELCKPAPDSNLIEGFSYSKATLKQFDRLRHDVVHDLSFWKKSADTGTRLTWAFQAGLYFAVMVRDRYGFKFQIDTTKLPTLLANPSS